MKWLKVTEAGELTGFSPRQIRYFMSDFKLPYARIGRSIRISEKDLDNFMERHKVGAKSANQRAQELFNEVLAQQIATGR